PLRASSMNVSLLLLLLLLLLSVCEQRHAVVSPDGRAARLRALWKLQVKESLLRGKGEQGATQKLLYCRVGIGYHLQILSNGSVGGVHKPTDNCWLKVFAMKRGVVGIRGVKTGLYLCMGGDGLPYGADKFSDDCLLKENLEENHYTTYSSATHPGLYLALSHKGELRKGHSVGPHQSSTHFLPRRTP
uniref:Fibroblast growth factor n=1 Tax=Mola mola TaxID=94237 RepID=A0A3Q3XAA5_MOLML